MTNEQYETGKVRYEELLAKYNRDDETITIDEIFELIELREIYDPVEE